MRFVTFSDERGQRVGILLGELGEEEASIVDLSHGAFAAALGGSKPDMLDMVQSGLGAISARLSETTIPQSATVAAERVRIHAPLLNPPAIIGVAHNFRCALAERGIDPPRQPVVFDKRASTIIGPGDAIKLPVGIGGVTYEAELAVIIGTGGRDIHVVDALDHVAGYAAFNDVSASEMIKADASFDRGKNIPTFAPFGPYIATVDEIADPQRLAVRLHVDGVCLQDSSTEQMLFSIAELIAYLSKDTTLQPGTVIATGTPAGVAPVRQPHTWLRAGTTVSMSVQGLGLLTNPVEEATQ